MFKFLKCKNSDTISTQQLLDTFQKDREQHLEFMRQNTKDILETALQVSTQNEHMIQKNQDQLQQNLMKHFEDSYYSALARIEDKKTQEHHAKEKREYEKIKENQLKAAYALNLCVVSLSQIVDYQDINVLQQEYDAILNNLNMENIIKDEALLDALKKILDTCHFYLLHEKDKKLLKKKQAARLKGALGRALGGKNIIALFGTPNPWAIAASAAIMVGSTVVSYKSEKNRAEMENEEEEWQLQKSALEQLHNLRRILFETAWRLSEKYQFPDKYRLTETQIKIYNDILTDSDPLNRYERLELIKDNFKAYPLYWYYLGRAALEAAEGYKALKNGNLSFIDSPRKRDSRLYEIYRAKAKESLEQFVNIHNENQLLREDVLAASAYLDYSDFCLDNPDDLKKMVDSAKEISGLNFEILQTCAFRYLQLVEMFEETNSHKESCRESAAYCLRILLNEGYNKELNGRALSKLYIDGGDSYHDSFLMLKTCLERRSPFVYRWLLPWDMNSYKDDVERFLKDDGIYQIIAQYLEGRLRCIFAEFYLACKEAGQTNDMTPLRQFKDNKLMETEIGLKHFSNMAETQRSDVLSSFFESVSKCRSESKLTKSKYNDFVKKIEEFVTSLSIRNGKSLWLVKHSLEYHGDDFSKSLKEIDDALYVFIEYQTQILRSNLENDMDAYLLDADNLDASSCKPDRKIPKLLTLIFALEEELESMRFKIQDFTPFGKRFYYHNFSPVKFEKIDI